MAAPTPDPGIAALAAELPCVTRRWFGEGGNSALFTNYNFFPWRGQPIDTNVQATTSRPWTSDDDKHAIP